MSDYDGATGPFPPTTTFTVDRQQVMHETMDDETIVINLGTGTYYSIGGYGVDMWAALVEGDSLGMLIEQAKSRFPDVPGISTTVHEWVARLQSEGLVEAADAHDGRTTAVSGGLQAEPDVPEATRHSAFRPPTLERYTDMQALLLLDPVHEVDAGAGWPNPPADHG